MGIGPGGKGQISTLLEGLPRRIRANAERNLVDAGELIVREMREAVGVPGPGHSRPGEPPRKQSGRLQRGIVAEPDLQRLEVRILSTAPYSKILESGGGRISPRPFFTSTILRLRGRVAAILQRQGRK